MKYFLLLFLSLDLFSKSWSEPDGKSYYDLMREKYAEEREQRELENTINKASKDRLDSINRYEQKLQKEREEQERLEARELQNTLYIEKQYRGNVTNIIKSKEYDFLKIKTSNDTIKVKIEKGDIDNYIYSIQDNLIIYGTCYKKANFSYHSAYYDCDINFEY
jgi:vacuolar-type H+-ATPase subunit I/STV1